MFSWDDYTKVSKSIHKYAKINSTVSEGFYRSSVSRAYYAVYHAALFYAENKRSFVEKTYQRTLRRKGLYFGSHNVLIQYLLDDSDPDVQLLGAKLKTCRDKRVVSDYKQNISVDDRYAQILSYETDNILSLIDTLAK